MERLDVKQTQEALYSADLKDIEKGLDNLLQAKHENLTSKQKARE